MPDEMVTSVFLVSGPHWEHLHQYIQFLGKEKQMNVQQFLDYFRQLPASTQVAVVVFALVFAVLLVVFPAAGTTLITFLLGLKMLIGR